jgi:hypothetical protein
MFWVETILSLIMGTMGTYMLYRGKKIMEPKMMLWGGVLIVLSYFLFSGGGKDDDSKAVLKKIMTGSNDQGQDPQGLLQPSPTPTVQIP